MTNVVEVLEHWAAGRPLRAIAESLGLDRNTVRKYITPAREAGFGPGHGAPADGWAAFVAAVCPQLGMARKKGTAWDELAARHDEIAERLKVNRPSTVWQRMHDDDGLQASLPSFRRYALANLSTCMSETGVSVCASAARTATTTCSLGRQRNRATSWSSPTAR